MGLSRNQAAELLTTLTPEEHEYKRRRANEIFAGGGDLAAMIRVPLEEIAEARASKGGGE